MATIVPILQILISVILVIGILLQSSDAGLGAAFGGGADTDSTFSTRRGFDKVIFNATILAAILFAVISFTAFLVA